MLPPVRLTGDVVKTFIIAYLNTRNQPLPCFKNRQILSEELIGLFSETQLIDLLKLNDCFVFQK